VKEYSKTVKVDIEVWVSEPEISEAVRCVTGNYRKFRAGMRLASGHTYWQWYDKYDDAVAWCESIIGNQAPKPKKGKHVK